MKKFHIIISLISLFLNTPLFANDAIDKTANLPYYDSAEFTPKWLLANSTERSKLHTISDFKFINQQGKYVTPAHFKDKIYVASFFFTSCPGICPKMRSQLSKVQDKFANNDRVSIISHSIQPENDTVKVLKKYADEHNVIPGKWHLVTGNRDEIYALARNDYFANEDLGKFVSDQDFLHTENLVLIDNNKHIRGIYNGLNNVSVNHLLSDINLLLVELQRQAQ